MTDTRQATGLTGLLLAELATAETEREQESAARRAQHEHEDRQTILDLLASWFGHDTLATFCVTMDAPTEHLPNLYLVEIGGLVLAWCLGASQEMRVARRCPACDDPWGWTFTRAASCRTDLAVILRDELQDRTCDACTERALEERDDAPTDDARRMVRVVAGFHPDRLEVELAALVADGYRILHLAGTAGGEGEMPTWLAVLADDMPPWVA